MERLRTEQPKGLTREGVRKWAMLFVTLGVFGRSILLNRFLGAAEMTADQLLEAMSGGSDVMTAVTIALICLFAEACGAPLFCLLLAEGMDHTANAAKYIGRVLGLAAISEIPYNIAMSGKLMDLSSRNPVFGMAMALILLFLYTRYSEKGLKNLLLKVAFTIAAVFWSGLLRFECGIPCVILAVAFWSFRNKPNIRNLMGGIAAMLCSFFSVFFMMAPMGMMVLHFYNGEKGEENRLLNYLFYPAVLTVFALVGFLAFR
jgi:hypothetical protein